MYKENICTRHMHTARTPGPPPQVFQLRKMDALRSMHPAHFTRRDQIGVILSEGAARQNRSYINQNLTHKVSDNLPSVNEKVVALCL